MPEEPGAQACACAEGVEGFGEEGHVLSRGEGGFDGGQEPAVGPGKAVGVVDVGDVDCEACGSVGVCEEADVGEGPAESYETL